jgi:hypothetical protein
LSQPDMKGEMVSPPAGAYIPSFTIYHVLPDLPGVFVYQHVLLWSQSTSSVLSFL